MDRLLDDIERDASDINKGGKDSHVIKSLRNTRNILNTLDLGD